MCVAFLPSKADEGMWLLQLMQEQHLADRMKAQGLKLDADDIYHPNKVSLKDAVGIYNPQNHLAADNKTTCLIFPLKQKTKRLKKRSKQHTKSVIQMLFKSHLNNTFYI